MSGVTERRKKKAREFATIGGISDIHSSLSEERRAENWPQDKPPLSFFWFGDKTFGQIFLPKSQVSVVVATDCIAMPW